MPLAGGWKPKHDARGRFAATGVSPRGKIPTVSPAGRKPAAKKSALYNPDGVGWGALAGAWHTPPAKKSAPAAPSAPAPISEAEKKRRQKILAAPLARPRAMRPEDGAGVFSADPETARRAAAALDAKTPTKKATAKAGKRTPLSAVDGQFRPVPLPSKEQRDRTILGDREYERRQAAKKAVVPKVRATKAAAEAPETTAAKIQAAASEHEAKALLQGLTVARLKAIAPHVGVHQTSGRKADLIDKIAYSGVGSRLDSEVFRTMKYTQSSLSARKTAKKTAAPKGA